MLHMMVVLRLWICIKINHSTVMKIIAGNKNFNTFVRSIMCLIVMKMTKLKMCSVRKISIVFFFCCWLCKDKLILRVKCDPHAFL